MIFRTHIHPLIFRDFTVHASLAGTENEKFLEQVFTLHGHVEGNMVLSSL